MIRINLLPVREAKKRESGRQILLLFAVCLAAEIAVLLYWQSDKEGELSTVDAQVAKLQANLKTKEAEVARVVRIEAEKAELEKQKNVLDGLIEGQAGPVKMLDELSLMITPITDPLRKLAAGKRGWNPEWDPKRLWLESFTEENRKVKLMGLARTNDDLAEFLTRLNTSKHFVKVHLNVSEAVDLAAAAGVKLVKFDLDAVALYGPTDVKRLAAKEIGDDDLNKKN
ncbi:MAG: hypothetical protein EXR76_08570 [Myxococcales bacterium]|nr:hypothetical protein [Myxococcales bacterium]